LFIKRSGGPFVATAEVSRVLMVDRLTPAKVDELVERYNEWICGPDEWWAGKRGQAKFATLMWLRRVEPSDYRPRYKPQNMRAWYLLGESPEWPPLGQRPRPGSFEVVLTDGGIRNGYVRLNGAMDELPADSVGGRTAKQAATPLTLHLPGDIELTTDINGPQKMFRTRRWRKWFVEQNAQPGDRLQFEPFGLGEYEVTLKTSDDRSVTKITKGTKNTKKKRN
jgi:hypothetical protein